MQLRAKAKEKARAKEIIIRVKVVNQEVKDPKEEQVEKEMEKVKKVRKEERRGRKERRARKAKEKAKQTMEKGFGPEGNRHLAHKCKAVFILQVTFAGAGAGGTVARIAINDEPTLSNISPDSHQQAVEMQQQVQRKCLQKNQR